MKSIFNLRPCLPRYINTWDPDTVLEFLKNWDPPEVMTLKNLTLKVTILLSLLSGRRGNTLVNLNVDSVKFSNEEVIIYVSELTKTSKISKHEPLKIIPTYTNKKLCLVHYLRVYIDRTKEFRNQSSKLLISFIQPHKPISVSPMRRWIREVLR